MYLAANVPLSRTCKSATLFFVALIIVSSFGNFTTRASAPTLPASVVADDPNYIPADMPTSGDHELDLLILHTGAELGVDPRLLHAVIWQESRYKPTALSHAGAQGLMQLIPATAKRFDCADAHDPQQNLAAGAKYLRWLLARFDGDVTLALAGYNAGEGAVDKYEGVPPYSETQNYVRIIVARYGQNFHPLLTPAQARIQFHLMPELAMS